MAMVPKKPGVVTMSFASSDGDQVSAWIAERAIRFEVQDVRGAKVVAELAAEDAEQVAMHLMLLVTRLKGAPR